MYVVNYICTVGATFEKISSHQLLYSNCLKCTENASRHLHLMAFVRSVNKIYIYFYSIFYLFLFKVIVFAFSA